jgi:predicted transcriptional regulator
MSDINSIWNIHRDANWPIFESPHVGELMTIDTVMSGAVVYFLDHPEGLDLKRVQIVEGCVSELNDLLAELSDEPLEYFERLKTLGALLLSAS